MAFLESSSKIGIMDKEDIRKQIDIQRDIKTHLWNALLLTIAGTIGLSFNLNSYYKFFLLIIGIVLSIIFFLAYFKKDIYMEYLLDKSGKDEQ